MKRRNQEVRRQVEEMNHKFPTQHGFGPTSENIWTTNDEDDEINRVLTRHSS